MDLKAIDKRSLRFRRLRARFAVSQQGETEHYLSTLRLSGELIAAERDLSDARHSVWNSWGSQDSRSVKRPSGRLLALTAKSAGFQGKLLFELDAHLRSISSSLVAATVAQQRAAAALRISNRRVKRCDEELSAMRRASRAIEESFSEGES